MLFLFEKYIYLTAQLVRPTSVWIAVAIANQLQGNGPTVYMGIKIYAHCKLARTSQWVGTRVFLKKPQMGLLSLAQHSTFLPHL